MSDDDDDMFREYKKRVAASQQRCGICGERVLESKRYPNYACDNCANEAVDQHGRAVSFSDELDGYSLTMRYRDAEKETATFNPGQGDPLPTAWVRGIECTVNVAHFGGIVMTPKV